MLAPSVTWMSSIRTSTNPPASLIKMKELTIQNCIVRIFDGGIVKVYAESNEKADRIWDYLIKEYFIK